MTNAILLPVIVLAAWSMVMWIWLYATRIPAMQKAEIDPEEYRQDPEAARAKMPMAARQVADNYNHLMEQPTVFYAVALALAVSGAFGQPDVWLAWGYVLCRVVHSIWQAAFNIIMVRFLIFVAASLCLFGLIIRALLAFMA